MHATTAPPGPRTPTSLVRGAAGAAVLDVAAVLVFAAVGRRSHAEGVTAAGVAGTAWPFLVGLALGWVATRAWRAPTTVRTGAVVWASAVVVGVLLRAASGRGVPVSFVVVTAVTLGVLALGWRLLARALAARSARRPR